MEGSMEIGERCRFVPILVEPKYQGNIGSIARLAKNFSMEGMMMVNPPDLEDEAKAYSMHGRDILDNAKVLSSFGDACDLVDQMIGTSGVSEAGAKNYHRNPISPEDLSRWSRRMTGTIGIAFGREDIGLLKEELDLCDLLVTIPASPNYPILNLSHAAGILFYEIWKGNSYPGLSNARTINNMEKRSLLEHYERMMEAGKVPEHKVPIARTNFRRMISRAGLNYREFNTIMGTFSRVMDYKRKNR